MVNNIGIVNEVALYLVWLLNQNTQANAAWQWLRLGLPRVLEYYSSSKLLK